ncbi:DUF1120 domain-containing protein [Enterobacter sp. RHBSTW-00175]|uniref:DUF1120 domain-containing protein n=1 Tax=Enterobacter sp. RHBSTW-00175 TaxID=2742639 RepID=UPI0015EA21E6|nr:DUF1120 domain-containing protein [Enterobacter sp. RHBSTW-00175]QMR75420.1 DUF1120 domain-containing protein [Enterobacter sp. RHBSTW-00175]
MKNGIFKYSLLAGAMAFSGLVMANPSATLAVKGQVSTGTCTATLTKTNIDLGNISADILPTTKSYQAATDVDDYLYVDCTSPLKMQVSLTDNRADSPIPAADINSSFAKDGNIMGLGKTNTGENIGGYTMSLFTINASVDGKTTYMNVLSKTSDESATWVIEQDKSKTNISPLNNAAGLTTKSYISLSLSNGKTPYPTTSSEYRFKINAYISSKLRSITDQQTIDGNVTFNVDYL